MSAATGSKVVSGKPAHALSAAKKLQFKREAAMREFRKQLSKQVSSYSLAKDNSLSSHDIEACFLGPRGENAELLEELATTALRDHVFWRRNFHPDDPVAIKESTKRDENYLQAVDRLKEQFYLLLAQLKKSVPFFSMRYLGHMNYDTTLPSILGYLATMLYNPNNVAAEASPVTAVFEMEVGQDLCRMLGFQDTTKVKAWSHLTSGGTTANIESMWIARNAKFYPFAVRQVLSQTTKDIQVEDAKGQKRNLKSMSAWEMFNIPLDQVLEMPNSLEQALGPGFEGPLTDAILQTTGVLGAWQSVLSVDNNVQFPVAFVSGTAHYSLTKAFALLGLGAAQLHKVSVDTAARLDVAQLEQKLRTCMANKQPVLCVVVIVGSTEESAVDPLVDVLNLRTRLRQEGLDFHIHVDAAWSGYFCSMLHNGTSALPLPPPILSQYVYDQLVAIRHVDTVTIDPHKTGYIPYAAGAVAFRNGQARELAAFSAPYINAGDTSDSKDEPPVYLGSYGVEGSKAGATAAAVYLSHRVIPLDLTGHGKILARSTYCCKLFYLQLLEMKSDRYICVPLPETPQQRNLKLAQESKQKTPADLSKLRHTLQSKKLHRSADQAQDVPLSESLKEVGPDTNILCFAFNLRYKNGQLVQDIDLINEFNNIVFSFTSMQPLDKREIGTYNLLFSSTTLTHDIYGDKFMNHYANRLREIPNTASAPSSTESKDIFVMRSTFMDPWLIELSSSQSDETLLFENILIQELDKILQEAVKVFDEAHPSP